MLYEEKSKPMGNVGRNGGEYDTPAPLIRAIVSKEIFHNYFVSCADSSTSAQQAEANEKRFKSSISMARKARDTAISLL